jgi:hypothetical protein
MEGMAREGNIRPDGKALDPLWVEDFRAVAKLPNCWFVAGMLLYSGSGFASFHGNFTSRSSVSITF